MHIYVTEAGKKLIGVLIMLLFGTIITTIVLSSDVMKQNKVVAKQFTRSTQPTPALVTEIVKPVPQPPKESPVVIPLPVEVKKTTASQTSGTCFNTARRRRSTAKSTAGRSTRRF